MNYRLATIHPRTNYTADKTEIIDIDLADPISQIVVIYEPDNNTSSTDMNGHPARCVSKIEVVDGTDVIFSLSGIEAQAVDFYHNNQEPVNHMNYLNGMYHYMVFNLNFGRFLFDPELALDPKKFRNPQIKVTLDIDAGGDDPNDGYLTVLAHIFDERTVSPIGFLMHKEIKTYTLVNASHEYTDLPTDYPYKQLFVRAQRYTYGPDDQIDEVKLSEEVDRKIPVNHKTYEIIRAIASQWKPYSEGIMGPGNLNEIKYYCTPTYWTKMVGGFWVVAPPAGSIGLYCGPGGQISMQMTTATGNWEGLILGHCPHGVVPVLPKFGLDYANWYNVTRLGSLKLDLLGGASVGTAQTCEIFLQQLRRY